MRSRKLRWMLVGLVALIAAGAFVLWPENRLDRVTRENYERLHKGMSQADVDAILGPPGDYRTGPTRNWKFASDGWDSWSRPKSPTIAKPWRMDSIPEWHNPDGTTICMWEGNESVIWVLFRPSGLALNAEVFAAATLEDQGVV